jgi:hypothetical protein
MKKALRVATVFTGVAGCAAAFGPAAAAATAAPGTAVARAVEAANVDAATIESGPCNSGTTHWLHLYDGGTDRCVGFPGTLVYKTPPAASAFCPGNNYGYIEGASPSPLIIAFRQGATIERFTSQFRIQAIHISGWSGNETCPAL